VNLDDVRDAAARLEGVAHRTPVLRSRTLDRLVGAEVFLECGTGRVGWQRRHPAFAELCQGQRFQ
jgi:hypothetical protein